jgi:hypothetical protein
VLKGGAETYLNNRDENTELRTELPMAYAEPRFFASNILHILARPFVALDNVISSVAEARLMADAANRIYEMSDEKLAAKGLTRSEAIQMLFSK